MPFTRVRPYRPIPTVNTKNIWFKTSRIEFNPDATHEQLATLAIRAALCVTTAPAFVDWANNWLYGGPDHPARKKASALSMTSGAFVRVHFKDQYKSAPPALQNAWEGVFKRAIVPIHGYTASAHYAALAAYAYASASASCYIQAQNACLTAWYTSVEIDIPLDLEQLAEKTFV